jgi:aspartyl-tRNA(Asn)/glutamyl-tRNA(Gln) amidotransferase subunit C
MSLSLDEVRRIATLARLELTDAEISKFQGELSRILEYVEQLKELDTTDVEPTSQVTGITIQTRVDEVREELPRDVMLASAIDVAEGHLKVKSVLGRAS